MPRNTRFAGLTALEPGDSLSDEGSAFLWRNPDVIDRLLEVGAVLHRHDAHPALGNPLADPVVTVAPTGGLIPSDQDIYVCYTLFDADGGETLANPNPQHVVTADAITGPADTPTATPDYAGGVLLAATYFYEVTVTDGAGGETTPSPYAAATIDPGYASGEVLISGLSTLLSDSGGTQWRLWRSTDGSAWYLLDQGVTDTFLDDGTVSGDCTIQPPTVDTTGATSTLTVTVPLPSGASSGAVQFAIYAAPDDLFLSPALLGIFPSSAFGEPITFPSLSVITDGTPPPVSLAWPGATKIDADTEWLGPWRRAVPSSGDLPLSGNEDGDTRLTLDALEIWSWDGTDWSHTSSGLEISGPDYDATGQDHLDFESSGGVVLALAEGPAGTTTLTIALSSGAQEGWHEVGAGGEPAFQNGWANLGGNWETVAFMKDLLGFVHLKGHVSGGVAGTIFQLPAGYRPAKDFQIAALNDGGGVSVATFEGMVEGASAGIVSVTPAPGWLSLSDVPPFLAAG